jgi:hypothetical protein
MRNKNLLEEYVNQEAVNQLRKNILCKQLMA